MYLSPLMGPFPTQLAMWAVGLAGLVALGAVAGDGASNPDAASIVEHSSVSPRGYVVGRAATPPRIDGRPTEEAWSDAAWTAPFVNSKGPDLPAPEFRTRAKMMWDDRFLYIAATLEEPHVRASYTTRDTSVWRENAFEVFIDPTGDTHHYYEYQINARGTQWDLMLTKPYRDGGVPLSAWDIRGLKKGVAVQGTLNDPSDEDEGWSVELALPWSVLAEAAPGAERPQNGDQWRVNLTRMQWPVSVVDGEYVQDSTENETSVWSPIGRDGGYHKPERWGIVQFADADAGTGADTIDHRPNRAVEEALRTLYYRQLEVRAERGLYASTLSDLNASTVSIEDRSFEPTLEATQTMYEITAPGVNGTTVHIRHDGKVWTTE